MQATTTLTNTDVDGHIVGRRLRTLEPCLQILEVWHPSGIEE
jgi:hypothetical protein